MYTDKEKRDLLFILLRKLAGKTNPGDEERQREIQGKRITSAIAGPANPDRSKRLLEQLRESVRNNPEIAAVFDEEQVRQILGEEV